MLATFERIAGRGVLGNRPASGTAIIDELGDEHLRTGKPIVYTSADSVFQVAAHEEVIPLPELYRICEAMRAALTGPHAVGRVIARPFLGVSGGYYRDNEGRHDWALLPPEETALDVLVAHGIPVRGVGKIADIFAGRGVTSNNHALNNEGGIAATLALLREPGRGLIFTNLIEFDMVYGHRKDPQGYADALARFDSVVPEILNLLGPEDALLITGDHGVDPSPVIAHTDHTREYVPLLGYGYRLPAGAAIGTRPTFADLGCHDPRSLRHAAAAHRHQLRRARMSDPALSRQSKDIILKHVAGVLGDGLFRRFGIGKAPIARRLPTELPVLEVRTDYADLLYELTDDTIVDLELQTGSAPADIERFADYSWVVWRQHRKRVRTVVLYGPRVTVAPPDRLDAGGHVFRLTNILLADQDGEAVLARLQAKRGPRLWAPSSAWRTITSKRR